MSGLTRSREADHGSCLDESTRPPLTAQVRLTTYSLPTQTISLPLTAHALAHRPDPMPTLGEKGMLPLPGSSRRPRTYFPSNPSSQPSLLTHLRSRTRLTNLAVVLIILLTTSSILLNAAYYLSPPSPPSRLLRNRPGSIEDTILRDPRISALDHLVMVPGHAIWTGHDANKVEEDSEWVLQDMQKGGSVRTFLRHLEMGVEVMKEDERALLVFSG